MSDDEDDDDKVTQDTVRDLQEQIDRLVKNARANEPRLADDSKPPMRKHVNASRLMDGTLRFYIDKHGYRYDVPPGPLVDEFFEYVSRFYDEHATVQTKKPEARGKAPKSWER